MTVLDMQTMAQVFSGRLVNTAVEGMVLAALIWMILRLTGRQNSGTRFAIWFSALLAVVALPFFSESGFGELSSVVPATHLHSEIVLSSSWAFYLFAAWAAGAGLSLLKLCVGFWRVRSLRKNCSELDLANLDPEIAAIVREFASRRRVRLCVSSDVNVPAAIGFFRPVIIFPEWLLPRLSTEEFKVILLHELAHLHRRDDWTNLAQKTAKAVFFFHPAVWWIENRLTLEREMACDDVVLAQTTSPKAYVSSLISFAEKLHSARSLALAQALVSRMRQMSARIKRILDADRPTHTGIWKPIVGVSAGLLGLVLVATPYAPRIVAFQNLPDENQTAQVQAANRDVRTAAAVVNSAVFNSKVKQIAQGPALTFQARAIPTVFHPRKGLVPRHVKAASPRNVLLLPVKATPKVLSRRETVFILQTTRYDVSGASIWTLCVWRIGGGTPGEKQLESAIVLSLI